LGSKDEYHSSPGFEHCSEIQKSSKRSSTKQTEIKQFSENENEEN